MHVHCISPPLGQTKDAFPATCQLKVKKANTSGSYTQTLKILQKWSEANKMSAKSTIGGLTTTIKTLTKISYWYGKTN
jgi:hypothetical protein